jgi:hypothetical protein
MRKNEHLPVRKKMGATCPLRETGWVEVPLAFGQPKLHPPRSPLESPRRPSPVSGFVEHYNTVRLHSAIGYITPADKLAGKEEAIFFARDQRLLRPEKPVKLNVTKTTPAH